MSTPGQPPQGTPVPRRPLADRHGRVATDLRVSLTDRCSLRCVYCMPAQGLTWLPSPTVLSDTEVIRLVRIAVEILGVTEVRFTGGEPLLRPGLVDLIAATAATDPRPEISLTTNGIGLVPVAQALATAGLDRINVSLDTLSRQRFQQLAHRDRLSETLAGLAAAAHAGIRPVKVNTVLVRGINDDEAPALLAYCLVHGYELRFIEQMPLDPMNSWDRGRMVTAAEILTALQASWVLTGVGDRGGAPAETWLIDGGPARVGIVGSVTRPFCAACTRTRLTADGQVRSCLFAHEETDLRSALRGGASDDDLAALWQQAMAVKKSGHGIDEPGFTAPARPMSAIGG